MNKKYQSVVKLAERHSCECDKIDRHLLSSMTFQVFLIRSFEKRLLDLLEDGCIHGPVHTSIGEEACAVGSMAALKPTDKISSTHRAHHHYLAKTISHYASEGFEFLSGKLPDGVQGETIRLLSEIMGLSTGCCGGRGGSMHLRNSEIGVFGTNAIVGGGIPLATGAAYAAKYKNNSEVNICFLGDGAVNQGAFHESLNLAAIWKLPIIYFIENNQYAVATHVEDSIAPKDLALKAVGYGIKGITVDGMDPLAVMRCVKDASERALSGAGPTIINALCYRFLHHAGPLPGSAFGYRSKEEEQSWIQKDPVVVFPEELCNHRILTKDQIAQLNSLALRTVERAVEYCTTYENGKYYIRKELLPNPETIFIGVRSDNSEFADVTYNEIEDFSDFETTTYLKSISAITGRHLEKNADVFILGEGVADFGGGLYGATKGLPEKFPGRLVNTPISECGFIGLAGGAAMSGLKPIVEIMYPDFSLVAADQLFNQIGKVRHIYGNSTEMPLVARTLVHIGRGYGGQHSMDPVGLFSLFSSWIIVAPSNAFDYIGLFNAAMRSKNPVLIVEHHTLYSTNCEVPKGQLDYFVPIGRAKVVKKGTDVTVLCYSSCVSLVTQASTDLKQAGIDIEIIDLRTISLLDIDYDTIGISLQKTNILVIVEQASECHAIGTRIAYECQKRFFDYLDGPIVTVAGKDVPFPVSKVLEASVMPTVVSVKGAIQAAARREL